MDTTIAVTPDVTTLVNTFTVEAERQGELLALLRENTDSYVSNLDGWISTSLIVAKDRRRVVIHSQWRDLAAIEAMRADIEMQKYFPRIAALASVESVVGDVVHVRHA